MEILKEITQNNYLPKASILVSNEIICEQCTRMYTLANCPLILRCYHRICRLCMENIFIAKENALADYIEVICLKCCAMERPTEKYLNCGNNFAKFSNFNFQTDYGLLTFIYKNYSKQALKQEKELLKIAELEKEAIESSPTVKKLMIQIKFVEDPNYLGGTDEKVRKEEKKAISADTSSSTDKQYRENIKPEHKKYTCQNCSRVFNKRNVPLILPCKHITCEECLSNTIEFIECGKISITCPLDASSTAYDTDAPTHYSCNWIARKIMKIDTMLVEEIYDKVSIEAKKAAYEYNIKDSPHRKKLEEKLCCQDCKIPFIGSIPYYLSCGHNTCIGCAYKNVQQADFKWIRCKIDQQLTQINQIGQCKTQRILKGKMIENTELMAFMKDCYTNGDEDYNPKSDENSPNECQICCNTFDKDKRVQYTVCDNGHEICKDCLLSFIKKSLENQTGGKIDVVCPMCSYVKSFPVNKTTSIEHYLKYFSKKEVTPSPGK